MEKEIERLAAPIAVDLQVDILDITLGGSHRNKYLKVIVDRAGGVDSTCLEQFSRALSLQLDAESLFHGSYRLEVSSPGLDWPLRNKADFYRHQGELLEVHCLDGRRIEGVNLGPAEGGLRIREGNGKEHHVVMEDVVKVVRAINWNKQTTKKRQKGK